MIISTILTLLMIPSDIIFYLKWLTTLIAVRIYRKFNCRRFDLYDNSAKNDPEKLGFLIPKLETQLESPFPESHLATGSDEVFFYGVNSSTECLVVRIARGGDGEAEAWIYLKLKNGKTYHLVETSDYERNLGDKVFSCGGLQMHYDLPMRSWRIFFCGLLSESANGEETNQNVFVKFVFLWKATSEIYDLPSDMHPKLVADSMAKASWKVLFVPPVAQIPETLDMYCQSGVFTGTVSANDLQDYEMYLFGEKSRYLGQSSYVAGSKFKQLLGNTPENGLVFHLGKMSIPNMFDRLKFGFVVQPSGILKPIERSYVIANLFTSDLTDELTATFDAGRNYQLNGKIVGPPVEFKSKKGWKGFLELRYVEFIINNKKGTGVLITGETFEEPHRQLKIKSVKPPDSVPVTVKFSEKLSQFPEISGGKGSSLGKLTEFSLENNQFVVPKGIIVTTSAYSEFLTREIESEIKDLEDIAYGNCEGDTKTACEKVSATIIKSSLPDKICKDIEKQLNTLFDGKINSHKFAVRSSATGEDTEQMSAAGQMDTFLGVQGLKEIYTSVKKCWASQFGYIAVEYKRRYGQPLNSPMAVVIQEMVACDTAGVLFTCDPLTNDPSVITLTGNYGLGESVVSGSEEPDTVILERQNDEVSIKSVVLGAKQHRIVMQENGGVITEDIPERAKNECCISEEMAMKLGKLAIQIEKYYRSPRDIEWGIYSDTIYLLQSRPITSGTSDTDFEIEHELDAPLRCELEAFTKANTGEVLPGASSPLGMDIIFNYFRIVFQEETKRKDTAKSYLWNNYFRSGVVNFYNHVFITVADVLSRLGRPDSLMSQGTMIGIFGRLLDDEEIFKVSEERFPHTEKAPSTSFTKLVRDLFFGFRKGSEIKRHVDNFNFFSKKSETAKEFFDSISKRFAEFNDAIQMHMSCSEGSMTWNILLFNVLGKNKGCFDNDVYSDFARLLSTASNVESADVPAAMKELAQSIIKEKKSEDFRAMSVEEAEKWLKTSTSIAGYKFRMFLKRHGHRCLKEFDVRSVPWAADPKILVKLLQNLSVSCQDKIEKSCIDYDKIFSELNTPLSFLFRCLVRLLLPNCRRVVGEREQCKSILIKSMDNWRKAYLHLSKLMVSEGRISDADLIFFFTLNEIRELLESRSPKLIARAIRRRKMLPVMDKYMFPEIVKGVPKPMNLHTEQNHEYIADLTMKGIPVSQGVVKGYARVAISLEEAADLKPAEILITYGTDIGWSPYFPILSGVVTELGGLISHGAVVSREYGLPCVVGLHGATKQFQTGDYVLLDGYKGILQKLPKPQSEEDKQD